MPTRTAASARGPDAKYFAFYNARRSHQSLDYRTPDEVYFAGLAPSTAAIAA
jgi:transposase InsO family protein